MNRKVRIIVFGLGRLGYPLFERLSTNMRPYGVDVVGVTHHRKGYIDRSHLGKVFFADLLKPANLLYIFRRYKPRYVINTAAVTDVDYCETHPTHCYRTNYKLATLIALHCRRVRCKLVQFSTDYVFDGIKGNYVEEDEPNPINVYGSSKYLAEKSIERILGLEDSAILRLSTPYHYCTPKKNLLTWILESLLSNREVYLVNDIFTTPTCVEELYELIERILHSFEGGIYHVGGRDRISRYQFGLKVAKIFGLDESLIHPVSAKRVWSKARRPKDSSLNSKKVQMVFGLKIKPVSQCLGMYKKKMKTCE